MSEVLIFDVNETLLDLGGLAPTFRESLGSDALLAPWFARTLRNSLIATVTNRYQRFDELAVDAFVATAREGGAEVDAARAVSVVEGMRSLPTHHDVPAALERLAGAGIRLATLTNSTPDVIADQLRNAGLNGYFEASISVDEVKLFKPHRATYEHAAARLGASVTGLRLVAAHDWDVLGALRAGARAAYVARTAPITVLGDEGPDIVGSDVGDVAERIIALGDER